MNPKTTQSPVFIALSDRQRWPCLLWHPPINPFQQHCQLRARDIDLPILGGRLNEAAFLQSLREQTRPLLIPPDDLQQITAPATEHKQMAGIWIFGQNLLGLRRKCVEPTPHARDTCRQPDPRVRWNWDHVIIPLSNRANTSGSKPPSALILWPPAKSILIRPSQTDAGVGDAISGGWSAIVSTGKNTGSGSIAS